MVAQARNLPVNTPGRLGINRQQENSILPLDYAVRATNSVIDSAGRLAARNGWVNVTSTPIAGSPAVRNVHTFTNNSGAVPVTEDIVVWDGGIGSGTSNPSGTDISGTLVDAAGDWYLANFNNLCIGASKGQKLAVYTGTGTFTEIAGSSKSNGVMITTAGRIWYASEDGTSLLYSDLLDHTTYSSGNVADMLSIWNETDTITGLAFFNSALFVFSKNQIVVFTDGQGSELGIDPVQMYVGDQFGGVGCVSHWTIQASGEDDLIFVSDNGITSIGRLKQERSNPTVTLTEKVRDFLVASIAGQADKNQLRSAFNGGDGFYILSIPDSGITFYVSMKHRYQDEQGNLIAPILEWDYAPTAVNWTEANGLRTGNAGLVGRYSGYDDNGSPFDWEVTFPWNDFDGQGRMHIPKFLGAIIFTEAQITVTFSWDFDFSGSFKSAQKTTPAIGTTASEWATGEWAISEWGGGATNLFRLSVPASGDGQYVQLKISITGVSAKVGIQTALFFSKLGRMII